MTLADFHSKLAERSPRYELILSYSQSDETLEDAFIGTLTLSFCGTVDDAQHNPQTVERSVSNESWIGYELLPESLLDQLFTALNP